MVFFHKYHLIDQGMDPIKIQLNHLDCRLFHYNKHILCKLLICSNCMFCSNNWLQWLVSHCLSLVCQAVWKSQETNTCYCSKCVVSLEPYCRVTMGSVPETRVIRRTRCAALLWRWLSARAKCYSATNDGSTTEPGVMLSTRAVAVCCSAVNEGSLYCSVLEAAVMRA